MSSTMPNTALPTRRLTKKSASAWLVYTIVGLAVVTNLVFGALSLFAPAVFLSLVGVQGGALSAGAQVYAAYAGARELAIAAALLVLLVVRRTNGVAAVMLLAGLANAFDAVHALGAQRWVQAPGALVATVIYLAAAAWLFRRSTQPEDDS